MELKTKVEELRRAVREEFRVTTVVLTSSHLVSPANKFKRQAAMEKTMARVDAVLDHILAGEDASDLGVAEQAVDMTVGCWRDSQSSLIPSVGVA